MQTLTQLTKYNLQKSTRLTKAPFTVQASQKTDLFTSINNRYSVKVNAWKCLNLSWALHRNGISFQWHSLNHIKYYTWQVCIWKFKHLESRVSSIENTQKDSRKNKIDEKLDIIHPEINVDNPDDEHFYSKLFCEFYLSLKYVLFSIHQQMDFFYRMFWQYHTIHIDIIIYFFLVFVVKFYLNLSEYDANANAHFSLFRRKIPMLCANVSIMQIDKNWSRLRIFSLVSHQHLSHQW